MAVRGNEHGGPVDVAGDALEHLRGFRETRLGEDAPLLLAQPLAKRGRGGPASSSAILALELARAEAGLWNEPREAVDVAALAAGLVESCHADPRYAGREVVCILPPDGTTAVVVGVGRRLERAFTNLLDNAASFASAEGGRVEVEVALQGDRLAFTVRDNGPGIAAADLRRIFTRFFTTRGDRRGTGLGLALAKAIVEAHGGTITATSTPGHGLSSAFFCRAPPIPAKKPQLPRTLHSRFTPAPYRFHTRKADSTASAEHVARGSPAPHRAKERSMHNFMTLLNIACGRNVLVEGEDRAQRLQVVIAGLLGATLLAALWGVAAGSSEAVLALTNSYKLPMVVLLSAMSAVPAGLLTWKLLGAPYRPSELLISFAAGQFAGTLVLAVLAPLVALYYHSSSWAGPMLAMGSVFLSLGVGVLVFIRGMAKRVAAAAPRLLVAVPVIVFIGVQLAALVQLIAIASPILPEVTVFDGGIDRMLWH